MHIIGDWGTTNFRLYLFDKEAIIDHKTSLGVGQIKTTPAECLFSTISEWLEKYTIERIILGGMAGSKIGIHEMPYLACPVSMEDWKNASQEIIINNQNIKITAGVKCENFAQTGDVMRGEEVQIFGAIKMDSSLLNGNHVFVLPGTHSKWAILNNSVIDKFHTFPTGELFSIISEKSTLLSHAENRNSDEVNQGFIDGLEKSKNGKFLAQIFGTRSQKLVANKSDDWSYGFLSGLMIGTEINDASNSFETSDTIIIIGSSKLEVLYDKAIKFYGFKTQIINGDECAINGLKYINN